MRKQSGTKRVRLSRCLIDHSSVTPDRNHISRSSQIDQRAARARATEHFFFFFSGELTFRLISFILSCLLLSSSRDIPPTSQSPTNDRSRSPADHLSVPADHRRSLIKEVRFWSRSVYGLRGGAGLLSDCQLRALLLTNQSSARCCHIPPITAIRALLAPPHASCQGALLFPHRDGFEMLRVESVSMTTCPHTT